MKYLTSEYYLIQKMKKDIEAKRTKITFKQFMDKLNCSFAGKESIQQRYEQQQSKVIL